VSEILDAAQLDALPVGARVIDRWRDILTKLPDGRWDSYETAPMPSARVAKWQPRLMPKEGR